MPDNQRPQRDHHSTSIVADALGSLRRRAEEVLPDSVVWVQKGIFTDTYFDNADTSKANVLNDGPFGFDSITCRNGAEPTSAQVRTALSQVQHQDPISETSTARAFKGPNPIAHACNIAPRPARGR